MTADYQREAAAHLPAGEAPDGRYARLAEEAARVLAEVREGAADGRESPALRDQLGELADAIRAMAQRELAVAAMFEAGRAAERAAARPVLLLGRRPQSGRRDRHGLHLAYSAPDGAR